MKDQQGLVVGVCSRRRPIEGSCDHCFDVDHGELMIDNLEIPVVMAALGSVEGQ